LIGTFNQVAIAIVHLECSNWYSELPLRASGGFATNRESYRDEDGVWRQANVPVNDNQNSRLSVELVSSPVCAVDAGWAEA
jgi:hypothetical protein